MIELFTRGLALVVLVSACIMIGIGRAAIKENEAVGDTDGVKTVQRIVRFMEVIIVILVVLVLIV